VTRAGACTFCRIVKGELGPLGEDGLETDLFAGL